MKTKVDWFDYMQYNDGRYKVSLLGDWRNIILSAEEFEDYMNTGELDLPDNEEDEY